MKLKIEIASKDTDGILRLLDKAREEIVYKNALKNDNINFIYKDANGGVNIIYNEPIGKFDWE